MRTVMLIILYVGFAALTVKSFLLERQVADLTQELEIQAIRTKAVEQNAIDTAHSVQDSLEERIGTLERDTGDLKYIVELSMQPVKTKKGKK